MALQHCVMYAYLASTVLPLMESNVYVYRSLDFDHSTINIFVEVVKRRYYFLILNSLDSFITKTKRQRHSSNSSKELEVAAQSQFK